MLDKTAFMKMRTQNGEKRESLQNGNDRNDPPYPLMFIKH